jgi:hypothetical protein
MTKTYNNLPPRKEYRLYFTSIRHKVYLWTQAREDHTKAIIWENIVYLQQAFRKRFKRRLEV